MVMVDDGLMAVLICTGMWFSVINGMNDISGLIAPVVATRATSVVRAHALAIVGLWLGIFLAHAAVARTVALGLVHFPKHTLPPSFVLVVWLGGVAGAVIWGICARRLGVPTSATHAFMGSLCGAALAASGSTSSVDWGVASLFSTVPHIQGMMKVVGGLILSPLAGSLLGYLMFRLLILLGVRASQAAHGVLRRGQCAILVLAAFCYGSNDAQNVMGAIVGALMSRAWIASFHVPWWLGLMNAIALTVGVLIGSSRIIRTVGSGLIALTVAEATCGQAAETMSVLTAAHLGAPVSSSQVLSSALVGAGGAYRPRHVRWARVRQILFVWIITFPGACAVGGTLATILRLVLEVTHGP